MAPINENGNREQDDIRFHAIDAAAAAGGYTFVNLMPNTKPVCSSADIAHSVMAEAGRVGLCGANQTVSITENFDGHTLDHLKTLPEDLAT